MSAVMNTKRRGIVVTVDRGRYPEFVSYQQVQNRLDAMNPIRRWLSFRLRALRDAHLYRAQIEMMEAIRRKEQASD